MPEIRSLVPASHTAGFGSFLLTVNGAHFDPAAQVLWCATSPPVCSPRTTTFVNTTRLTAAIPASDISATGAFAVAVENPGPINSASASFTVTAGGAPTATLGLFKVNNGPQVPDAQKLSPGAGLSINNDHDNGTSAPDNADSVINGDEDKRDMVTLALNVQPWDASSITVQLRADHPGLARVFDENGNAVDLTAPFTIDATKFNGGAINYHAEGLSAGTVRFTLSATRRATTSTDQAAVVVGQVTSIKLTFDDGPDSTDPTQAQNLTKTVIDTLASSIVGTNIPATFFVQTHVPFRGGSPIGQQMIQAESREGSHVEIHTGNGDDVYCDPNLDHAALCGHVDHTIRVRYPAYDVTNDGIPDGQNALESDLIQAKARLQTLTGRTPLLVRPPDCNFNTAVQQTYARVSLRMPLAPQEPFGRCSYLFDVSSREATACVAATTIDCMRNQLTMGIQGSIHSGNTDIVVLFHDIKPLTANHLTDLLKAIQKAVRYTGRNERFDLFRDTKAIKAGGRRPRR